MSAPRRFRALLIGNGTYADDPQNLFSLAGPRNDVNALQRTLTDPACGLHDAANVITLVDGDRATVISALDDFFSSAEASDQLLLYYTGHGRLDLYDRLYLCTRDTRSDRLVSTSISDGEITRLWEGSAAAAVVVVLDCCYSGNFKGGDPATALAGVGRWVLSSTRSGMLSKDAELPDGLSGFTHFFVEALAAGQKADRDGDGFITVADAAAYVAPLLETTTGQIPHAHFDGSGEVAIARTPPTGLVRAPLVDGVTAVIDGREVLVPRLPVTDRPRDEKPDPPDDRPALGGLVWTQEAEAFERSVLQAFRSSDAIEVTQFLRNATRESLRATRHPDGWTLLRPVLDAIMCLQALAVEFGRDDVLRASTRTLVRIYESGFDSQGFTAPVKAAESTAIRPEELWLQILNRLEAVGALATRNDRWEVLPTLVLQQPGGHDFRYYTNWFRHALTMAARANLFRQEVDGGFREVGLLRLTYDLAQEHSCVLGDLAPGDERLFESLGQFDFLACVLGIVQAGSIDGRSWYPNFAKVSAGRTEPIVRRLVSDKSLRAAIAPVSDVDLAVILHRVNELARNEGAMFRGWWGFNDEAVLEFVNRGLLNEQLTATSPFAHGRA